MSVQAGEKAGKAATPMASGAPEGRVILSLRDILSVFGRVLPYARRHWTSFVLGVAATVILNAASVVQPYILKVLTDEVLSKPGGDLHVLHVSLLLLLATAAVKGAFIYVQAYTMGWGTNATVRDIREDVYRHLQFLPLTWFDRQRLGDVIQRLTDDVRVMTELLARNLIVLMNDLLVSVSAIVYMVTQSPLMTALAFGLTPVTVSLIKRFDRRLEGDIAAVTEQTARRVTRVQEVLGAIRLVKLLGREADEAARDREMGDALFRRGLDIARVGQMENPLVESISTVSLVIVIGYGAYEVGTHAMTLGEFMAYWGYLLLASTPVTRLTQTLGAMRRGLVSADRVFMLKDIAPEPIDAPDAAPLPPVSRDIAFEHVHFGYRKGAIVLEDVHVTLPYGQMVAIVGPNGAGKSTLLSLLSRFHDPSDGCVRIDGHDLRTVQRKSLREQIGYVLQDNVLFSGTIRSNLAYGCPDATDAQLEQAARAAFCHDFIETLPQGYDTPVVEGGRGLSGGQRQRIAIARALLADPRILILDEATSALDPHAEREVQRAQEPLLRGRSTFVIAHRLSTIRRADVILVMERGRVVEQGTHDALMARSGLYRRLYDAFRGEAADADATNRPEPHEVANAPRAQGGEGGPA